MPEQQPDPVSVTALDRSADAIRTPAGVILRCSAVVFRADKVLLLHRTRDPAADWVLPGGSPRPAESTAGCARREVREETGLHIEVARIAFVLDSVDHATGLATTDIVFTVTERDQSEPPHGGEPGAPPRFIPLGELAGLHLRPPIAGYLRGLHGHGRADTAPYLGNLWRPGPPACEASPGNGNRTASTDDPAAEREPR